MRRGIVRHPLAAPLRVLIASTPTELVRGLSRRRLFADDGMLFVFPYPDVHRMTMRETFYPLDMIFLDADATVLGIVHSAPAHALETFGIPMPSAMVLETRAGWARENNVQLGDQMEVIPRSGVMP